MPTTNVTQSTTQQFLDVYDITNDVIILKSGASSIVLTVNAINFGLLAEEEQDAVIYQYAALLNSLNFPIQVVVRSQTKDATSYLQLLKDREDQTVERTKREWISRYREFVSNLIYERNVLDKKFYVTIPASYLEMGLTPAQNLVSGFKESTIEGVEKSVILEKALNILEPRRDHLISQFARIGLLARQLKTQEIIQLFYTSYNPEAAEGQQITDSRSYTTPLVQAQIRGVLMNDTITTPTIPQPTTPPVAPAAPSEPAVPPSTPTPSAMPTPTPMTTPSVSTPSIPTPVAPLIPPAPIAPPTTPPVAPSAVPTPPSISESPTTIAPAATTPPSAPVTEPTPTSMSSSTLPKPSMPPTNPTGMGTIDPVAPINSGALSATTSTPPTAGLAPTPATDGEAQAMINSTLKELTSAGPTTPAVTPSPTPVKTDDEQPTPDLSGVAPFTPPSSSSNQ